jgi:Cu/Ag efflux protein CusF
MRTARIAFASAIALNIVMSAALAQQNNAGMVTKIDRLNGTIAIQQTQSGTVGAGSGSAVQEFKIQDGKLLESFHAGDKVTYSATESGGVKTITTLQKE